MSSLKNRFFSRFCNRFFLYTKYIRSRKYGKTIYEYGNSLKSANFLMINHSKKTRIIFSFKRMTKWHFKKDNISNLSPLSSIRYIYMAFAWQNNSIDYYSVHAVCTAVPFERHAFTFCFVTCC